MSSSLDDMPSYEHFQQEMDDALALFLKKYPESNSTLLNAFIEFICFHLFIDEWKKIDEEVLMRFKEWLREHYPEVEFKKSELEKYLLDSGY